MARDRSQPWREPSDGTDERARWRNASLRERGDALVDLLGLVDAIGRYPEPRTRWPGFRREAQGRAEGQGRLRGLAERVVEIHRGLDRVGIAHAFGGAIAYAYHGEPRATRDIDLNVFLPSTEPLPALDALFAIGVTVDRNAARERIHRDSQVRLRWGPVPVDLFFSELAFHDACQRRVQHVPFGGVHIPILSAEDLTVCKIAFDREKDWLDVGEMLAIQGERFDARYVQGWLDELLGPDDRRSVRFRALSSSGTLPQA